MDIPPLSEEEEAAWTALVDEGREIRAPRLAAKAALHERNVEAELAKGGRMRARPKVPKVKRSESLLEVPVEVKRFIVTRAAGVPFKRAGELSGASWLAVMDAKNRSEECRCAMEAENVRSHELMKAKAKSIVEQSQDEGTRVSMAQTQVSIKILESLERETFGRDLGPAAEAAVQKAVGNGGFVINLIADAAKVADSVPEAKPKKALVYADV